VGYKAVSAFDLEASQITNQLASETEVRLNHMPRQSLGFITSREAFQAALQVKAARGKKMALSDTTRIIQLAQFILDNSLIP
jgi:hypothetical protein